MATFRKQDPEAIKAAAAAAKERDERNKKREEGGGNRKDIVWGKFPIGTNRRRVCPPWGDSGLVLKEHHEHGGLPHAVDAPIAFRESRRGRCLGARNFPNKGATCPICEVLRKWEDISEGMAKGFWARLEIHANTLDRLASDPFQVRLDKLPTASVGNWFSVQQNVNGMDYCDVDTGVDLVIEKTKTGDENWDVEYKPSTDPRGPSPLVPLDTPDRDAVLDAIAEGLTDLDQFYGWPSDKALTEITKSATILDAWLARKYERLMGAPPPAGDSVGSGAAGGGPTGGQNWGGTQGGTKEPEKPEKPKTPAPPKTLGDVKQPGAPDCFAGARMHTGSDDKKFTGTQGHQEGYLKCVKCPFEIDCESKTKAQREGGQCLAAGDTAIPF